MNLMLAVCLRSWEYHMTNSLPCFVYLDSKIIGSALQICTFFDYGVFDKNKVIVLVKKYKHKSNKIIGGIFKQENIQYCFVVDADLDNLESGVIFYPFNAQSNCRAVANRNLTHIFITHGESNKVSSIKPIIRIYDYVITAGQAGIERYLNHHIFSQYDVDKGRIISLGDTFIGKTGLSANKMNKNVIFYAPTWEGGIERENYSSLSFVDKVTKILIQTSKKCHIDTVVIKPHPNMGHRLKEYRTYLFNIVSVLRDYGIGVVLFKPYTNINIVQFLQYKKLGVKFSRSLDRYHAIIGFCDISAMETQFLNEDIPYHLFLTKKETQSLLKNHQYQQHHFVNFLDDGYLNLTSLNHEYYQHLKVFFIEQKFLNIPINKRIGLLLQSIIPNVRDV